MNKPPQNTNLEWEEDCKHFYDRVLTGEKRHWCPEYDYLPIDETCSEMKYCHCYDGVE